MSNSAMKPPEIPFSSQLQHCPKIDFTEFHPVYVDIIILTRDLMDTLYIFPLGKPLQCSSFENPMNSMKKQKDMTLKNELPRLLGAQYATREEWRNNSRKNEETEPKQKQHPIVNVTGDGSKVWCYKEQYCIETWNVRSMDQGKFEVVKQEMARVNMDILGISELKWTRMGKFNSD